METIYDDISKYLSKQVMFLESVNKIGIFGNIFIFIYAVIAFFTLLFLGFLLWVSATAFYYFVKALPYLIAAVMIVRLFFWFLEIDLNSLLQ